MPRKKILLSLAELMELPDASNGTSGVYFLWDGSTLQYIGQSRMISNRIAQHRQNYLYGHTRNWPTTRIKFDRSTMIELDDRTFIEGEEQRELYRRLLKLEEAYVNAYATPFNTQPHRPTRAEIARAGL